MTETVERDPVPERPGWIHCKEHGWKLIGESCAGFGETLIKDLPAPWQPAKKLPNGDPVPDSSRPHIPEKD